MSLPESLRRKGTRMMLAANVKTMVAAAVFQARLSGQCARNSAATPGHRTLVSRTIALQRFSAAGCLSGSVSRQMPISDSRQSRSATFSIAAVPNHHKRKNRFFSGMVSSQWIHNMTETMTLVRNATARGKRLTAPAMASTADFNKTRTRITLSLFHNIYTNNHSQDKTDIAELFIIFARKSTTMVLLTLSASSCHKDTARFSSIVS